MRRTRCAALCAVLALVLPAAAHAHPRLLSSDPASQAVLASGPRAVELRFNEQVDPVGAGITVVDPQGREVSIGRIDRAGRTLTRAVTRAGRGSYLVEWLVVGPDTHPARGAFVFSVGEATRSGAPGASRLGVALQALGRWLSLAGFALGFGVAFACAATRREPTDRLWHLVGAGIALLLVAEPVALLGETETLQPGHAFSTRLAGDVLLTSYGHAAGLRLGAALALWAIVGAARQTRSPWLLRGIVALGAGLAVVRADAGHRISGLPGPVSLLLEAVHIAAAVAWLGLVVVVLADRREAGRRDVRLAVGATVVLGLSGIGLAIGHLTALRDLVETAYGSALFVKLGIVSAALLLGGLGRRKAEVATAAAVLAAAAVLVSLLPPS